MSNLNGEAVLLPFNDDFYEGGVSTSVIPQMMRLYPVTFSPPEAHHLYKCSQKESSGKLFISLQRICWSL